MARVLIRHPLLSAIVIGISIAHATGIMPDWWYDAWKWGYHNAKEGGPYQGDDTGTFEEQDVYDEGWKEGGGDPPEEKKDK